MSIGALSVRLDPKVKGGVEWSKRIRKHVVPILACMRLSWIRVDGISMGGHKRGRRELKSLVYDACLQGESCRTDSRRMKTSTAARLNCRGCCSQDLLKCTNTLQSPGLRSRLARLATCDLRVQDLEWFLVLRSDIISNSSRRPVLPMFSSFDTFPRSIPQIRFLRLQACPEVACIWPQACTQPY